MCDGSGITDPRILHLGTNCRWVVGIIYLSLFIMKFACGSQWVGEWLGLRTNVDAAEYGHFCSFTGIGPMFYSQWPSHLSINWLTYSGSFSYHIQYWNNICTSDSVIYFTNKAYEPFEGNCCHHLLAVSSAHQRLQKHSGLRIQFKVSGLTEGLR